MESPDDLQKLYGQAYVDRFEQIHTGDTGNRLARLLRRVPLDPEDEVVDFGCGSGLLMPLCAPLVRTYVGVDFSQAFITTADARRERLGIGNAVFVCGPIESLARDNPHRFKVGFALDLSEHVYDREWTQLLIAMRESLAPGGRLYLHTPNASFIVERMKAHDIILKQFPEHVAVRSMAENIALLKAAGFAIGCAEYLPHYNALRLLHPLGSVPVIGSLFRARLFIEALA